jgi:hypothetical protein
MTPLLIFLFGFKPTTAIGTDLLFASITKMNGTRVHHSKNHSVNWNIVKKLSLGSLPASILTLLALKYFLSIGIEVTSTITFTLGIALLLTAIALITQTILKRKVTQISTQPNTPRFKTNSTLLLILTGIILGVLVTLSSVGAGVLGTVALLILYPNMPTVNVVGTDLAHAVPLTLVAGIGHLTLGNVDIVLLISLLIGSIPGIWVGSKISAKLPDTILRPFLAIMLVIIGIKFIL